VALFIKRATLFVELLNRGVDIFIIGRIAFILWKIHPRFVVRNADAVENFIDRRISSQLGR